jgi:hypothetical protein
MEKDCSYNSHEIYKGYDSSTRQVGWSLYPLDPTLEDKAIQNKS